MTYVRAETRPGELAREWHGELAAEETTHTDDRVRWVEFRVYRLDEGGWLVHIAGMSSIYHRLSTGCRTRANRKPGVRATVADLPDDAEPCSQCHPPYPEDLGEKEAVRFEFPRNTFAQGTPAEVVSFLTHYRERETGIRVVKVSEPVAALLKRLAARYPEFAVPLPAEGSSPALAHREDGHDEPEHTGDSRV